MKRKDLNFKNRDIVVEELKAAEQYLSTGGRIQSPTSLLPAKDSVTGRREYCPLKLIELNLFKAAELDYLDWMEAKA